MKDKNKIIQVLIAITLGTITGILFKEKVSYIFLLSDIFLNIIFTVITPLVFFTVSSSIINTISFKSAKKVIFLSVIVFITMILCSSLFTSVILNLFYRPNINSIPIINGNVANGISISKYIINIFTVENFGDLFNRANVLPLVIFSIIVGIAVKSISNIKQNNNIQSIKIFLNNGMLVMKKIMDFIFVISPIGLFACFAKYFGTTSVELSGSIIYLVVIFYILSIIFAITVCFGVNYKVYGSFKIDNFKYLFDPIIMAVATQSSLATLPTTCEAVDKMKVRENIYNLVLPLGSVLNTIGSSMAIVAKIYFLYFIFDIPVDIKFYFISIMFSLLTGFLNVGVPNGSLVLEPTILAFLGLPSEAMTLLVLVNYLLDPMITVLNVICNIFVTLIISLLVNGKDWYSKKYIKEDLELGIYVLED